MRSKEHYIHNKGLPYLKEIREKRDYGQTELAEKIGLQKGTISRWERGESTPFITDCIHLADALSISLDCLTGRFSTYNPNELILKNMLVYFRLMTQSELKTIEELSRYLAMRSE